MKIIVEFEVNADDLVEGVNTLLPNIKNTNPETCLAEAIQHLFYDSDNGLMLEGEFAVKGEEHA